MDYEDLFGLLVCGISLLFDGEIPNNKTIAITRDRREILFA